MAQTILVIEDNDDIRQLMVQSLKMKQYGVHAARNGKEGIELAAEVEPDLIICDIMMPSLNGYEVYKRLFEMDIVPLTPFVFITALGQRNDIRRGMVLGADDYIVKPFSPSELQEAVKSILMRRELLQQLMGRPQSAYDVFLSYSHQDTDLMEQVKGSLQEAGFAVWADKLIEPGHDWAEVVAESIKNSGCVVAVLTEHAADSVWVGRELGYAEINDTQIFPLLLRGRAAKAIPLRLINHQYIDAREAYQAGMQQLIRTLKEHLGLD
jgi:DNA-binding response OmpR family regulator